MKNRPREKGISSGIFGAAAWVALVVAFTACSSGGARPPDDRATRPPGVPQPTGKSPAGPNGDNNNGGGNNSDNGSEVPPPQLTLSTTRLGLGDGSSKGSFAITNVSTKAVSWRATSGANWFRFGPAEGTIPSGRAQNVTVLADEVVEGKLSGTITIQSSEFEGRVEVTANIVRPPRVGVWMTNSGGNYILKTCVGDYVRIRANVVDQDGIASVKGLAVWDAGSGQMGQSGPATMPQIGSNIYQSPLIFIGSAGYWTFTVVAVDQTGRKRIMSAQATVLRREDNRICGGFTQFRYSS